MVTEGEATAAGVVTDDAIALAASIRSSMRVSVFRFRLFDMFVAESASVPSSDVTVEGVCGMFVVDL